MHMYMSLSMYISIFIYESSWPGSGPVRVGAPEAAEALHAAGGQTSAVWHQLPAKQRRKAGQDKFLSQDGYGESCGHQNVDKTETKNTCFVFLDPV